MFRLIRSRRRPHLQPYCQRPLRNLNFVRAVGHADPGPPVTNFGCVFDRKMLRWGRTAVVGGSNQRGDAMTSDLGLNKESEAGVPNQNPAPADESPSAGMPQTRTLWIW